MKHYLLISLLLIAFNTNSMMMVDMMSGMGHESADMFMSDHHEMSQQTNNGCDEDVSCGVCLTHCSSLVTLMETPDFNNHNNVSYGSSRTPSGASGCHSRLLRPPRLS